MKMAVQLLYTYMYIVLDCFTSYVVTYDDKRIRKAKMHDQSVKNNNLRKQNDKMTEYVCIITTCCQHCTNLQMYLDS